MWNHYLSNRTLLLSNGIEKINMIVVNMTIVNIVVVNMTVEKFKD